VRSRSGGWPVARGLPATMPRNATHSTWSPQSATAVDLRRCAAALGAAQVPALPSHGSGHRARLVQRAVRRDPWPVGRSHSVAVVGCIVWSTTASTSADGVSRSTWSRRRVLNASMVRAVWHLRRLKRRSTPAGCGGGPAGTRRPRPGWPDPPRPETRQAPHRIRRSQGPWRRSVGLLEPQRRPGRRQQ
jgi:hypothetical protein